MNRLALIYLDCRGYLAQPRSRLRIGSATPREYRSLWGASVRIVHHLLAYLKETPIEDSLALDRLLAEISELEQTAIALLAAFALYFPPMADLG
jgi:hypothetical protein